MAATAAIGSSSSYAQSPAIRAKVISLTSARSTVVLGKAVYRHDQRKISNTTSRLDNLQPGAGPLTKSRGSTGALAAGRPPRSVAGQLSASRLVPS